MQGSMASTPTGAERERPCALVVEDNALLALDIVRTLEDRGLRVVGPCLSYRDALVAIARERPHYAVLDLNLGRGDLRPGYEGERLLAVLRDAGCRCVVHSGHRGASERLADSLPHLIVIPKPALVDEVVDALLKPAA